MGLFGSVFDRIKKLFVNAYICPDCGGTLKLRSAGWQCEKCKLFVKSIDVKKKIGIMPDSKIYESTELKIGKGWLEKKKQKRKRTQI